MDQRSYAQYCATARTLDIVGERWTLLLVRELLTGPKRFGDLQRNLRGLGTGLLSARMKHLEREGLVERITLPPPARTPAYALTEAGAELGPAVLALARWGLRWAMDDPREDEAFHPGWAVLGLKAAFVPAAAAGLTAVYEFRTGDETFHARVDDGEIETVYGPAQHPDVVITLSADAFRELASGHLRLGTALESGAATATGDRDALRRLGDLFRLPARRTR
ncbi:MULTISPECIES: winged helix-turn-helix transcriptional regulator [Thermomonosporaceae]|uniref:winged helix-turn-helix transcriptional regulator n=1 Tax=Thermomonosporaceae TaxID=2012 RepID=UPI00255ADB75|nr:MULTISPECIES: winged helix-turn-helix transcriptional regulator [Thermomonosporaceae]MDL4770675.1 winged helix-turn-helix transcriptional regulator [Actinomadura xylanilytica]